MINVPPQRIPTSELTGLLHPPLNSQTLPHCKAWKEVFCWGFVYLPVNEKSKQLNCTVNRMRSKECSCLPSWLLSPLPCMCNWAVFGGICWTLAEPLLGAGRTERNGTDVWCAIRGEGAQLPWQTRRRETQEIHMDLTNLSASTLSQTCTTRRLCPLFTFSDLEKYQYLTSVSKHFFCQYSLCTLLEFAVPQID